MKPKQGKPRSLKAWLCASESKLQNLFWNPALTFHLSESRGWLRWFAGHDDVQKLLPVVAFVADLGCGAESGSRRGKL